MGVSRFNGSDAARRTGCSRASAASQASRWLRNQIVIDFLAKERDELEGRIGLEEDQIISELEVLSMFDIRNVISWTRNTVTLRDSAKIPDELARCIAGVEENLSAEGKTIKVKFHDRLRGLENLAKIKGLYKEGIGQGSAVLQFINYDAPEDET